MKASEIGNSGALLDTQKSDTTDEQYEIRWSEANGYSCSCQGFMASKKRPKLCKHVSRYEFKYMLDSKILDFEHRGFIEFQSPGAKANVIHRILEIAKEAWRGKI